MSGGGVEIKQIIDPIELLLMSFEKKLRAAWDGNQCLVCPLAELAAQASATTQLYRELRQAVVDGVLDVWKERR